MTAAGFAARAAASAEFWSRGEVELIDVVDRLQAMAERNGLVMAIGQDAVQRILHEAFNGARGDDQ